MKVREDELERFWDFIRARQEVWWRRHHEEAPPPWTDDPILQSEHYTNMYRELDPGTRWCVRHILNRQGPSDEERVFNVMVYRLVGREETYERLGWLPLGEAFRAEHFVETFHAIQAEGGRPWTRAYMVHSYHSMGSKDKAANVAKLLQEFARQGWPSFWRRLRGCATRAEAHATFCEPYGWGRFLAFQILVDCTYSLPDPLVPPEAERGGLLGRGPAAPWSNYHGWATAGPGTMRGLQRVFQGAQQKHDNVLLAALESLQHEALRTGPGAEYFQLAAGWRFLPLSRANLANCLCEFYKYRRRQEGGNPGRRYHPMEVKA